jgi:hypothetical protein
MLRTIPSPPETRPARAFILLVSVLFPLSSDAVGLRYGFETGTAFNATVTFEATGEILSASGSAPLSLAGAISRSYRVADREPGRLLEIEPALESAEFRLTSGTDSYTIRLTPDTLEVNGAVAWASETGRKPPLQYLPFLQPGPVLMDRRGRPAAGMDPGRTVEAGPGAYKEGLRHVNSTVSSLFAGAHEIFPVLPDPGVEPGTRWEFRGPVARMSTEGAGLVRSATYTIPAGTPVDGDRVTIEVVEQTRVADEPGFRITDTLTPDESPGEPDPSETRNVERTVIRFRALERNLSGEFLFDTRRGVPLSYEAAGGEDLEVTAVRRYMNIQDVIPVTYRLKLEMRVRFEYPDGG